MEAERSEADGGSKGPRKGRRPKTRDLTMQTSRPAARTFAGRRYTVRLVLGEGSQKVVYLVQDETLGRECALAWIKVQGLEADVLDRLQREAGVIARLGLHPNIVTIFDVGEEDGRPYLTCEYLGGGDLRQALRAADGPLAIDRALAVAQDLCRGLALAHEHRILHRDIKPANVWLTEEGAAKLGDFGLAMSLDRSRVTQAGTIMGTAAYMAPEQALGGEVDARSDLYSLGCVLYEMVTGRPPFLGDDAIALVSQHINTAPVAPSWHQRNIPQALERLTLRLLAKAPEERPKSATEVLAALEAIAEGPQEAAPRVEANPLDRLAGGVFVGREQELGELRSSLDQALAGHGRLVLLAGEPGIGKTRLAEELATYAQVRGAQVLWGRCYEGEGAPAFWPWVQAIRSYVYERPAETLLSELGTGAANIAQIVSEVRERLPGLPSPPAMEPEQARFRLFDSITTFLKNGARAQPLVLMLDDLHWADKPSLLLLQFLARELRDTRFFVLGSYRDIELGRQHPLSHTLAELAREQLSQRIVLRGLGKGDVGRFIELTAGIEPPTGLVTTVYRETEGNPFFVKEVVSLLASERRLEDVSSAAAWTVTIPQSVREVIGRRLDQLSAECNQVLTIASVIGREFALDTVERVSEFSGDRLLDLLEEALAARVITELPRSVGHYNFSHALVRETLYEELSTIRRVRLHRQIAEALEALYGEHPEPHLTELAYHFCEAAQRGGDADKAIDYARRAATRASSMVAHDESVRLYELAVEMLSSAGSAEPQLRCDLLVDLGESRARAGEHDAANSAFTEALELGRAAGLPDAFARAVLGLAQYPIAGISVNEPLIQALEEAVAMLGEPESALLARTKGKLASSLYFTGQQERMLSLSAEAVEMARRSGDEAALASALASRHTTLWRPERLKERLEIAREIVRVAASAGAAELQIEGHSCIVIALLEQGDVDGVDAEIRTFEALAEQLRYQRALSHAAMWRAARALMDGRFKEAETLAHESFELAQRSNPANALLLFSVLMLSLRREQGLLLDLLPAVQSFVDRFSAVPGWRAVLAYVYTELDRDNEARTEYEACAAHDFHDLPHDLTWLIAMTLLAETCFTLRDSRRAAELTTMLLPYAERCVVVAAAAACYGSASRQLGLLAATLGRRDDAIHHFESALELKERMRARPLVARTEYQFATALLRLADASDLARATALLRNARATAVGLEMNRLVAQCDGALSRIVDDPGR